MDSQKRVAEFCVIIGKFATITLDLLPQKFQLRLSLTVVLRVSPCYFRNYQRRTERCLCSTSLIQTKLKGKLGSSVFEQGIEEKRTKSSICLTKITKELDKGKGHVFSYHDPTSDKFRISGYTQISHPKLSLRDKEEDDTESSASHFSASLEPVHPTGFRLGPSSGGRVSGIQGMSKAGRRRPSSWKIKAFSKASVPAWMLAGDFNELLSNDEKSGGAIRSDSSFWGFRNMLQDCKLREIRDGFEDMVRRSWEGKSGDRSSTMDRIGWCRRRIMNWKRNADLNSRNKIVRLKAALEIEKGNIAVEFFRDLLMSSNPADLETLFLGFQRRDAIVDLTLRVSDLIDGQTGTWDHNLVRQLIIEEDVNLVLNTKLNLSRADKLIWGLTKNGRYDVKSGYKLIEALLKVVFEFSALEVKKAMDHPLLCFGNFQPVSHALSAISSIRDAKISYVPSSCNLIANLIAVSVTRDQRYQSYVARNGPAWLATQIGQEASA
ncbi:hypothetical protein HID58_059582 [Brassica napus]|uniref:Uncharacterized protein n=1 Tax=Brassica napus TaxID=3708 RepID=A0ABQ7ZTB0_BRANA|nr:hypothetical protein HID58_059582 [Brassica napus]